MSAQALYTSLQILPTYNRQTPSSFSFLFSFSFKLVFWKFLQNLQAYTCARLSCLISLHASSRTNIFSDFFNSRFQFCSFLKVSHMVLCSSKSAFQKIAIKIKNRALKILVVTCFSLLISIVDFPLIFKRVSHWLLHSHYLLFSSNFCKYLIFFSN